MNCGTLVVMFSLVLLQPLAGFSAPGEQLAVIEAHDSADFDWSRVLKLQDYNTRVVVGGAAVLGIAAGVIGSFTLLRKRALVGDALSHAMLPGIGLAFILSVASGGSGKSLPALLMGATVSGLLGLAVILMLRRFTRLKEDTALGIVLSVFFGAGVAVLGVVQRMGQGHAAGLETFIYGKTASMLAGDAMLIGLAAAVVIAICTLLFKEFKLLCFDADFAQSLGWSTLFLDVVMMGLVVIVTVIGLQAVGLILIIALLIIPAAAARFWTEELHTMTVIAAMLGGISGALGSAVSALAPDLPSGATIVLVAALLFGFSMLFGTRRGVLQRWWSHRSYSAGVRQQHLLRAAYETIERLEPGGDPPSTPVPLLELLRIRSWSPRELLKELRRASRNSLVRVREDGAVFLTEAGFAEAKRVVRNHRLWEIFLITHADIAPSHVDRDADAIEHVLGPEMVKKLEKLLEAEAPSTFPQSPHTIVVGTPSSGHP